MHDEKRCDATRPPRAGQPPATCYRPAGHGGWHTAQVLDSECNPTVDQWVDHLGDGRCAVTGHRIEWDHSNCDHDGEEGWCSPDGHVTCETTTPDPLTVSCRVVCDGDDGRCDDGYNQCVGGCETAWTFDRERHPTAPHCNNGHLLRAAGDCQVELFLNEEPSLLREDDRDGHFEDRPITLDWCGDHYEWDYA